MRMLTHKRSYLTASVQNPFLTTTLTECECERLTHKRSWTLTRLGLHLPNLMFQILHVTWVILYAEKYNSQEGQH